MPRGRDSSIEASLYKDKGKKDKGLAMGHKGCTLGPLTMDSFKQKTAYK